MNTFPKSFALIVSQQWGLVMVFLTSHKAEKAILYILFKKVIILNASFKVLKIV